MEIREGGVTSAKGFRAASVCAGFKKGRKDMSMIVSEVPDLHDEPCQGCTGDLGQSDRADEGDGAGGRHEQRCCKCLHGKGRR